jgi:hypothetical protein
VVTQPSVEQLAKRKTGLAIALTQVWESALEVVETATDQISHCGFTQTDLTQLKPVQQ